jgi:hypothetical protein
VEIGVPVIIEVQTHAAGHEGSHLLKDPRLLHPGMVSGWLQRGLARWMLTSVSAIPARVKKASETISNFCSSIWGISDQKKASQCPQDIDASGRIGPEIWASGERVSGR